MLIIRKLIIKEWYKSFAASSIILFILISIANLISGLLRSNVTAPEVLGNYLVELPTVINRIFPIGCLMGTVFCVNKLKNRNELTAIFATGFSRRSFITTVVQASAIIAILQILVAGYLQPFTKKHHDVLIADGESKFRNLESKGLMASTVKSGKIWYKSRNYYFSFSAFDRANKTLHDVTIYFFDDDYKLQQKVVAQKAEHLIDNSWIFQEGYQYSFLSLPQFPHAAKFTDISIILNELPEDFGKIESDINVLYVPELWDYIVKLDKTGINTSEYSVHFWSFFSNALICIIFSLVAATSIFNPNRRSSSFGKSIGIVFVFVVIYWLISSYAFELGKNASLNPFIACFGVSVLFGLYLGHYYYLHRHLR